MSTKIKPLLIIAAAVLFLLTAWNIFLFPISGGFPAIAQILIGLTAGILAITLMRKSPRVYGVSLLLLALAQLATTTFGIITYIYFHQGLVQQRDVLSPAGIFSLTIPAIYIVCMILAYCIPKKPFCFILLAVSLLILISDIIFDIIDGTNILHTDYLIDTIKILAVYTPAFLISFQMWRDTRKQPHKI